MGVEQVVACYKGRKPSQEIIARFNHITIKNTETKSKNVSWITSFVTVHWGSECQRKLEARGRKTVVGRRWLGIEACGDRCALTGHQVTPFSTARTEFSPEGDLVMFFKVWDNF